MLFEAFALKLCMFCFPSQPRQEGKQTESWCLFTAAKLKIPQHLQLDVSAPSTIIPAENNINIGLTINPSHHRVSAKNSDRWPLNSSQTTFGCHVAAYASSPQGGKIHAIKGERITRARPGGESRQPWSSVRMMT